MWCAVYMQKRIRQRHGRCFCSNDTERGVRARIGQDSQGDFYRAVRNECPILSQHVVQ